MAGLKEIKIRIKSVKNTKKITYAMKLVSATKMRGAQEAVERSKDYSIALRDLLTSVIANCEEEKLSHPFLEARKEKNIRLIVIGSNRGLCGGFNSNINKAVNRFYAEKTAAGATVESIIIGQKHEEHFKRMGYKYLECMGDLVEDPTRWPLEEICQDAERAYLKEEVDAVYVLYTNFKSALSMEAKAAKLFPITFDELKAQTTEQGSSSTLFEPSAEAVFKTLLPRLVRIGLRQGALDSKASEHASRMTAMDSATKNAGELIDKLTLTFNKLRQASITAELLDIVGGANALE